MTDEGNVLEDADVRVEEAEAQALLRDVYGLRATVVRLTGERDQNLLVTDDRGLRYVLKISHVAEPRDVSDLQTRLLVYVAATDPDLRVPRLHPTREGAPGHLWRRDDGHESVVRLLSFLPGTSLGSGMPSAALLGDVGASLARLDHALAAFAHPQDGHHLMWDLSNLADVVDLLDFVPHPDQRRLTERGLHVCLTTALPAFPRLRRQVVHNDLNPNNVLVDFTAARVTGMLDFGDAVRAPLVNDLAVAAAYHVSPNADPLQGCTALVRGYAAVLPLLDEEAALLRPLMLGRMAMTVAIASWRSRLHPENQAYILRNVPAALGGLKALLALDDTEMTERLRTPA